MSVLKKPLVLGIFLFEGVELLDFCGPYEVFSCAENNFKVVTLGLKNIIKTDNGLQVVVDHLITSENLPKLDIVLLPGSRDMTPAVKNETIISWLKKVEPELQYLLSVCTGALLLCEANLLSNLEVTTHFTFIDKLREMAPLAKICTCRRFVDNGRILLSAGVSAGIDLSIYCVKKICGSQVAEQVMKNMEYESSKGLEMTSCSCNSQSTAN